MKAPRLFPCSNELTINSTFKIAVKHHEHYNILSNMPKRIQRRGDNIMLWTIFDELSVSAQQILVVITTFSDVSSHLINVTIWCRESVRKHLLYAQNIVEEVVPYFRQKYFTRLSKLDIVVVWNSRDDNIATSGLILFLR